MSYNGLRSASLVLLVILFLLLANAVKEEPVPVMSNRYEYSIAALAESVNAINSIEYKQHIKTMDKSKQTESIEVHFYYKKPDYLRTETKSSGCTSIDIYTPDGMYEYFPASLTAYYREKWKDSEPISFQLQDKLHDIELSGKYELYKADNLAGESAEIIRSVDEENGCIYEHRIWLVKKEGLSLPAREEYLSDGDVNITYEYEYVSINKNIDDKLFKLRQSDKLKIINAEGIPKAVKNEEEAEKYVKFNLIMPDDIPEGFAVNEITVVPPVKFPSATVTYIKDMDTVYYCQKNVHRYELVLSDEDKVVKSGGKTFAIKKLFNNSISIRWVKNCIEYEFSSPESQIDALIKFVQSVSGVELMIK
ncbi:MAG: hypothetical protein QME45_11465 [Clostridiales bacterium]|nr:hypothetical protein [Clostridiales bacterium]